MPYPFRNLVFEGGGVKGVAYVGALDELESRGILPNIERIGGTSAGAINAVLLALGYTLEETREIFLELDFNNFLDDSWGIIRDAKRIIQEYGLYKGDYFHEWIGSLIENKTGSKTTTFNDLNQLGRPDLYVIATNLSTRFAEVYSVEHTPRERVADAVRKSMSYPLFFAAVRDDVRNDVYVDGGVFNNYPVKLFDREKYIDPAVLSRHAMRTDYYARDNERKPATSSAYVYNKETLGFRLDTKEEIAVYRDGAEPVHHEIDNFLEYAVGLVRATLSVQANQHLHSDDWHRTIYIDTIGVRTFDFDLSDQDKLDLVAEGKKGVTEYFIWYDAADPNDLPLNLVT